MNSLKSIKITWILMGNQRFCILILTLLLQSPFKMLLSKLLQFIVLLASLIASISTPLASAENVYTVTPSTNLSPNLQYINTSQLRQKTAKSAPDRTQDDRFNNDPVPASSGASPGVYDRETMVVRTDKQDANKDDSTQVDQSRETLKQLLDRRLIKR